MELMRLRRRLAIAVHGHALLKDKLEGLMQEFRDLIERYRVARPAFDAEFSGVMRLFLLAGLAGSEDAIRQALSQSGGELDLTVTTRNLLSVQAPRFETELHRKAAYSLLDAPLEFDEATAALAELLPRLVELAGLEQSIWLLMDEIERTRRRVNALEYTLIPSLRETVRYIQAKLDENERANITRLMKIKDMRLAQEREALRRQRRA